MIIKTDPLVIAGYLEDASGFTAGRADRLVIPETAAELSAYLAEASRRAEPVTVSGGRTGVAAGAIPACGTLLSLEKFDGVGPIQHTGEGGEITVGAAARLEAVKAAAAAQGLLYAPDPTERTGTLGGNVATNASGGQGFKYGTTRAYVLGLRAVLSTGEQLALERGQSPRHPDRLVFTLESGRKLEVNRPLLPPLRVVKNAAGYYSAPNMDPLDLLIGMDGTLAVITEIKLKLLPAPEGVFSLAAFFPTLSEALRCADRLRTAGQQAPASLEFMDRHALSLLRPQFSNLPSEAEAALLIEQEYSAAAEEPLLAAWSDFFSGLGLSDRLLWLAATTQDRERLRTFRHALPETVNTIVRQRKFPKVGTDMAVPPEEFGGMLEIYLSGLAASGLEHLLFGHIGECHLHVNVLPRNQEEFDQAKQLYLEFARQAVARGGTVSAEHGIGKLKHEFLRLMVGEAGLREMARVKRALDPALILNRGNIFPEFYLEP
ncbi:MAG: FAD-binding oxidoreductase [candidate division FCPU426 bacterium]